jgi:hypothetical protein
MRPDRLIDEGNYPAPVDEQDSAAMAGAAFGLRLARNPGSQEPAGRMHPCRDRHCAGHHPVDCEQAPRPNFRKDRRHPPGRSHSPRDGADLVGRIECMSSHNAQLVGSPRTLGPLWVTGCREDYIDLMAGVPQIAADLLHRASRQTRARERTRYRGSKRPGCRP